MKPGSDCATGKEQFATRAAARERRKVLLARGTAEASLSVYRCVGCGCLHLGHTARRREVLRRRASRRLG
jgi:hypothetical protein